MEAATKAFSVMGACAFGLTFVPLPLRSKLEGCIRDLWEKFFSTADPFSYIEVSRKSKGIKSKGRHISTCNPFYEEVGLYLGSLNIEFATRRVCVYSLGHDHAHDDPCHGAPKLFFGLPLNETLVDTFEGAQLSWKHTAMSNGERASSRGQDDEDADNVFTLTMLKSDKPRLLHSYLNHISMVAHEIRRCNTLLTLYTNGRHGSHWTPITFNHPSTFDTIALDGDLAERIQADLIAFSESEAYYHSIGRAWKRGYLLYGPPGTGKSSLIAAIANFMRYDIYDLELTNVFDNSLLKTLLMQTTRKSIIVIEDIDCSMSKGVSKSRQDFDAFSRDEEMEEPPHSHSQGLTLSGLLNFADGLLSCFGEERIFIFTTNHKERLDSALLRCGRMDMHILLSYCTFSAFKKLAFNYLGIQNHELYEELEEAMKPGVKITPASIAEILISARKDPNVAMERLMAAIKTAEPLDACDKGDIMAATNAGGAFDKGEAMPATNAGDTYDNANKGMMHGEDSERSFYGFIETPSSNSVQAMAAANGNQTEDCVWTAAQYSVVEIEEPYDEGVEKLFGGKGQEVATTLLAWNLEIGKKGLSGDVQIDDTCEKPDGEKVHVINYMNALNSYEKPDNERKRRWQKAPIERVEIVDEVEKPKKTSKIS